MSLLVPKLLVLHNSVLKFNDKHEQHQEILLTARRGNELNTSTLSEEPYLKGKICKYINLKKNVEHLSLSPPQHL